VTLDIEVTWIDRGDAKSGSGLPSLSNPIRSDAVTLTYKGDITPYLIRCDVSLNVTDRANPRQAVVFAVPAQNCFSDAETQSSLVLLASEDWLFMIESRYMGDI
jgi:hypothetical protein